MVYVCPPTLMLPDRAATFGFAATLKPTEPLPVPVAPDVIVIQPPEDVAVQLHPASAVTLKLPVAVLAETEVLAGEIEYEQDCPVWFPLKERPPMVMAPLRDEVVGFAVTLNPT